MSEMKDSGIPWVGAIPADWEVEHVQGCFSCERRGNGALLRTKAMKFLDGRIVPKPESEIDEYRERILSTYQLVDTDAIVINGLNLNYDLKSKRTGIAVDDGVITSAYLVINPIAYRIVPSYANYLFKGYDYCKAYHNMGTGIRKTLAWSEYKHVLMPVPGIAEQQRIADYLDERCAAIDEVKRTLIDEIEALRRLRKSTIHRAVSKGLDEGVSMQDSGVEWIGEIPDGWGTRRLKNCVYLRARLGWKALKAAEYQDEGYPMFSAFNITNHRLDTSFANFITQERYDESPEIKLTIGDVLLVKDGAGYGKHAYVDHLDMPSTVNSSIGVMTGNDELEGRYLNYFLDTGVFQQQMELLITGMGVPHLTQHFLYNVYLPLPPLSEQRHIADYLDERCDAIDSVIDTRTRQLERLEDYRRALIFAYVTGKKEVPSHE